MKETFHEIIGDSCCSPVEKGSAKVEGEINRFASIGPTGAIITAVLASLCCVGPFVLVMLGASGAWIGSLSLFEPYRPIFILLTVGLLGAGLQYFYLIREDSHD